MKNKNELLTISTIILFFITLSLSVGFLSPILAQSTIEKQATPPPTQKINKSSFQNTKTTVIHWLGGGGFFINTHGCCLMIDPVLLDFDLPVLIEMPIDVENIPRLDGILITHDDADHFSIPTCKKLKPVCKSFHSTQYGAERIGRDIGPATGHRIGEIFKIGTAEIILTTAKHDWQNYIGTQDRVYKLEDCCGFWINTLDGTIWLPGDTKFIPELLKMPPPDLILLDISDSSWHLGLDGAIKLANAYPTAQLILHHWGTIDAPTMKEFNANPKDLEGRITNPERVHILAPGAPFILGK